MLLFPTNYFISSHYKIFLPALYRRRRCVQLVVLTHIYFHMKMYEHLFWDAVNSKQSQSCHSSFSPRILHNEKTIDQTHTQKDGSSFFFSDETLIFCEPSMGSSCGLVLEVHKHLVNHSQLGSNLQRRKFRDEFCPSV